MWPPGNTCWWGDTPAGPAADDGTGVCPGGEPLSRMGSGAVLVEEGPSVQTLLTGALGGRGHGGRSGGGGGHGDGERDADDERSHSGSPRTTESRSAQSRRPSGITCASRNKDQRAVRTRQRGSTAPDGSLAAQRYALPGFRRQSHKVILAAITQLRGLIGQAPSGDPIHEVKCDWPQCMNPANGRENQVPTSTTLLPLTVRAMRCSVAAQSPDSSAGRMTP